MNSEVPKWILVLLRWVCPTELFEMIEGDLIEQFQVDAQRYGIGRAKRKLIIHALDFLRPGIISRRHLSIRPTMTVHYLRFFFRGMRKHGGYSFINISGLSLGLATVLLIAVYIVNELSYDSFNKDADRIFRIVSTADMGGEVMHWAFSPNALGEAIRHDYPQIEYVTRVSLFGLESPLSNGGLQVDATGLIADPAIFNIFSLPVVEGNLTTALDQSTSIILTKSLALKLFGQYHDVVGRMLVDSQQVTAVIEDVPDNSHLRFDFIRRFAPFTDDLAAWNNFGCYHYVKFRDTKDVGNVTRSLNKTLMEKFNADPHMAGFKGYLEFQPVKSIHLAEITYDMEPGDKGNPQYIVIFSILGAFILAIACINFTNLATVRGMKRAKEIGIRKSVGAVRLQLTIQLLGESMIAATLAMIVALVLAGVVLQSFNTLVQKRIVFGYHDFGIPLMICFGAMILSGILSGIYPALLLSSVKPASLIKGTGMRKVGGGYLSKALVIIQFSFSIMIVTGTFVVYSQLQYIRNKDLGYQGENVVRIEGASQSYTSFKGELQKLSGVQSVASAGENIIDLNGARPIDWTGRTSAGPILVHVLGVDEDFLTTMKIDLLKGRDFLRDPNSDQGSVLINEQAANLFGLKDPLGMKIQGVHKSGSTVVGVIKDFHFKSIHEKVGPLVLIRGRNVAAYPNLIRVEGDIQQTIADIENIWKKLNPGVPFIYSFINDDFAALYKAEVVTETLFKCFAGLGIVIACLGLFALSSYAVEVRNKEYSIRKVFGASPSTLFVSAATDHIKLVIVATCLAAPLAYYFSDKWLKTFAYHAELSFYPFAFAGLLSISLAFITVIYQSARVAMTRPNVMLRSE